ncbi:MAG: helix-turn-helix transcriptional regulator [Clostridia bacterium]|nr:helix-turn-helix transcriptional regulator [Clostridia bacterium]MBR6582713.1 helix-turn-helix transcriptional regulator [Treponema sp.]
MARSENNIAQNVYEKVCKQRVKQSDLAAACGCSPGMVTKIITGDKIPSVKILVDISEYLGCTVDDLLKG